MQYIRVKRFDEYQHYHDRTKPPIWIKLYNKLLDDYNFGALPDEAKFHFIGILLLASRNSNMIPADPAWIGNRMASNRKVDITILERSGLIEVIDSSHSLDESGNVSLLEKNREDKSREDQKQTRRFDEFWAAWPRHFRKVGKAKCQRKWLADNLDEAADKIMSSLRVCKATEQWKKQGGQFIPQPYTWLNQTPWESDLLDLAAEPAGPDDFDSGLSADEFIAQERQFLPPDHNATLEQIEAVKTETMLWEN